MGYLFEFINTAFPKAGMVFGGLPVTVAEIVFILAIVMYLKDILKTFSQIKGLLSIYIIFSFMIIISTITNLNYASLGQIFTGIILVISPLAIIIGYNLDYEKAIKIIIVSLIITGIYSIVQWNFGIENTAIYGLNIAYGDSFLNKPMGWGMNGREAIKMPSTYQNGNGVALFYAIGIPLLIDYKNLKNKWNILRISAILLGLIGLIMSGSRATIIPFIVLMPFLLIRLFKRKTKRKQMLFLAMFIFISIIGCFYIGISNSELISQAINRYIVDTISDPTGNGRTTQILNLINVFKQLSFRGMIRSFVVGVSWEFEIFTEGVIYILGNYGVIAFITFIILLLKPISFIIKNNGYAVVIGLLCVFCAFIVDTSFNYPPGLMNYFIVVGVFLRNKSYKNNTVRKGAC